MMLSKASSWRGKLPPSIVVATSGCGGVAQLYLCDHKENCKFWTTQYIEYNLIYSARAELHRAIGSLRRVS